MEKYIVDVYYQGHSEIEVTASNETNAKQKAAKIFIDGLETKDFFDEVFTDSIEYNATTAA